MIGDRNLSSNRGPGYSPQNGIAPTNAWFFPSVNGYTSTLRHIKYGVPQGSILDPLLFMNDLPNMVKNGKICMYVDDTNLSTNDISGQLIPEFTNVLNWLKENRLSLNFIKTKFILIGSVQKIQLLNNLIAIRVNGTLLKRVKRIRYLGPIVDEGLTWDRHIDPGDLVTKVKQINGQSDLIWMTSFAGSSHLTIRSSVYIILN